MIILIYLLFSYKFFFLYNNYMESLVRDMKVEDLEYRNPYPPTVYGRYNRQLAEGFGHAAEEVNAGVRSRSGPRNINSITDTEFSRLLNILTKIANA